jgi:ABC-type uncharacterized transport system involved in gliding motility auxiliary subunit
MTRRTLGTGAILALALVFVAAVVLTNWALRGARVDLTRNQLYTTTQGTRNIVKSLAEPVNLYLYFSEGAAAAYPQLRTYGIRVREFLQELAASSGGKLRLRVIDPQPFSEEEDRAAEAGVRAVPLGPGSGNLYLGLAGTNSTDGKAVIDLFDPSKEAFLEYDVAKLIHQLAAAKKPVVAWYSTLPMSGGFDPMSGQPAEPWLAYSQAQQLFDVKPLEAGFTNIDADVDALVLVHPKGLGPAALFAIDQFALRGGRVLLFVDPVAEADPSGADPTNPLAAAGADRASDLAPLLAAWGVAFDRAQAIGDLDFGLTVSMRPGEAPTRHIGILGLDESALSKGDVVTTALTSLNFASTGWVAPIKGAQTSFEPLIQTSTQAAPLPAERFQMLMDPATLRDGFKPTGLRYALAARVSGRVRSAYAAGLPPGASMPAGAAALKESAKPLSLIVVADTDMLADFLWVRQQNLFGQRVPQVWANNGDLVWNALENLSGSSDLIAVRGRATFTRPFDRVDALRTTAEDRFRAKEQELQQQLDATDQKLTELQSRRTDASAMVLTPEQEAELERFQADKLRIRKELREVRAQLDADIRALGQRIKFLNIVVAPLAFAGLALLVAFWRRRRRAAILALRSEGSRLPVEAEAAP